jgi:vacuolar-type H+-ATPase subunit F/Vma7
MKSGSEPNTATFTIPSLHFQLADYDGGNYFLQRQKSHRRHRRRGGTSVLHRLLSHILKSWSQDSITGLLLAGIGHVNETQKKNFLVVDSSMSKAPYSIRWINHVFHSRSLETPVATIEATFQDFTERPDIAILLINQHVGYPSCLVRDVPSFSFSIPI